MNEIWSGVVSIAVAIVGLATLAVIVGSNSQTSNVIKSAGSAFASDLQAAEAPVTGGSNLLGGLNVSGGASSIFNQ